MASMDMKSDENQYSIHGQQYMSARMVQTKYKYFLCRTGNSPQHLPRFPKFIPLGETLKEILFPSVRSSEPCSKTILKSLERFGKDPIKLD
jgi:hypothetical protein